jgi:hypothetical protein
MGKKKAIKKANKLLDRLRNQLQAGQAMYVELYETNQRGLSLMGDLASGFVKLVMAAAKGDATELRKRESRLTLDIAAFESVIAEIYEIGHGLAEDLEFEGETEPVEAAPN